MNKIVKQWFKYAATDLKASKNSLSFSAEFKAISAFHSQQCAEKAIKGYLAHHKVRFYKTHDIKELAKLVSSLDSKLAEKIMRAKVLSNYAVAYRYPDAELKPLTMAKARSAIKLAEMVLKACSI